MESASSMSKHNPFGVKPKSDSPIEKVIVNPTKKLDGNVELLKQKNAASSNTVRIRVRVDANYKVTGRYSGQEYLFRGAGSEVDVDKEDAETLLELRQNKGCCGGGGGNPVFELA